MAVVRILIQDPYPLGLPEIFAAAHITLHALMGEPDSRPGNLPARITELIRAGKGSLSARDA